MLPRTLLAGALAATAAVSGSCGAGLDDDDGEIRPLVASYPVDPASPLVVEGLWIVLFAEEARLGPAGTDLNGDMMADDRVAVALRSDRGRETNLGVVARTALVVQNEIYLVVDEAEDGVDWNGVGGPVDLVLLHWSEAEGAVAYVDTLPAGDPVPAAALPTRLYYAAAEAPGPGDATNLRYLDVSNPRTIVPLSNAAGGGAVRVRVVGADAELLLLAQDETASGLVLNGDGDQLDEAVLALLDTTDPAAVVRNAGLALPAEVVFDARSTGAGEWLVGVLVSEEGQGANLNDPALFGFPLGPDGCPDDGDTDDDVLFFLRFPDFDQPGMLGNTGLAGRGRVVVAGDHVATLSAEADAGGCDLNGDGDPDDVVVRWAEASATAGGAASVEPPRESRQLHAVATAIPGGAMGLAVLSDRLVAAVDEAADGRDLDGKAPDHVLAAWIDPADPVRDEWTFAHQNPGQRVLGTAIFGSDGSSEPYAGLDWMAPETRSDRLGVAFLEEVPGTNPAVGSLNTNVDCAFVQKDADVDDSLPVWLDFEAGPTLDFDGVGFALEPSNGGVVVARFHAYFRVSEAADGIDHDGDGMLDDVVVLRNPLVSCHPQLVGPAAPVAGPAIVTDGDGTAAFLSTGVDLDEDGDPDDDTVVRYFRY